MSKSHKVYKIKNIKTGEYLKLGYNSKSSWHVFPSEAIKCSKNIFNENNIDDFEIEVYDLVIVKKLGLTGKEIKFLTREILFEKTKEFSKKRK